MNKEEFLNELKIAINTDTNLHEDIILEDLPEWDSLAIMCTISMFTDSLNIQMDFDEIKNFKTIKDLMNKAGIK
ncbi:MAG: acyl carrier protein [Alphaproteobacteria bacterium]|nr:acyl carrier protein [Alphaproteobacteria bacterium]